MSITKKRIVPAFLVLLVSALLFTACGGGNDSESVDFDVDAELLGTQIFEATKFNDYMSRADSEIMLAMYGVDEELVEDSLFYTSTGATAEELAVIVVKMPEDAVDSERMTQITALLQKRVDSQSDGFADYVPEELTKLKSPAIMSIHNTAILLIADDTEPGTEVFEKYFTKQGGEK